MNKVTLLMFSVAAVLSTIALLGMLDRVEATYNAGCIHAQCIDQCGTWGNSDNCDPLSTSCTAGDNQQPPPGTDFHACNGISNSTAGTVTSIMMCSPDPAGSLIMCQDHGSSKYCAQIFACWCYDNGSDDFCSEKELTGVGDQDDC
jgi:hypothetical protein